MVSSNRAAQRDEGRSAERQKETDERAVREERLLDAATVLLIRWGYRKTTIDDVAREAGVGKGTIYLHWKDKNELFRAAIRREQQRYSEDLQQRIAADPEGGLLHRITMHGMLATAASPLITAIYFGGKSDIFNGFIEASNPILLGQLTSDSDAYIKQLQEAGLVRSDLPASTITYMLTVLKAGVINTPDFLGQDHRLSLEAFAEVFSDLVCRWLEPERLPAQSEAGKQLYNEFMKDVNRDL